MHTHSAVYPYHGTVFSLHKDRHSDTCYNTLLLQSQCLIQPGGLTQLGTKAFLATVSLKCRQASGAEAPHALPRLLTSMAKPQPLADEGQQRGGCCKEWQWRASEEEKYFPTQTSASRAGQAGGGGGGASPRGIYHKATGPCTSQAPKDPQILYAPGACGPEPTRKGEELSD